MLYNQTIFGLAIWLMKSRREYGGRLPEALQEARRFVCRRWSFMDHFTFAQWVDAWKREESQTATIILLAC